MELELSRRWYATFLITMATSLDEDDGHLVGLGTPSPAVEAVRHLRLPGPEERRVAVSLSQSLLV